MVLQKTKRISLTLVLFLSLNGIYALDISEIAFEAYLRGEFNRSSNYSGDISVIGELELNNKYVFRAGTSYGRSLDDTDFKVFSSANVNPLTRIPVYFSLAWIYNNFPEYEVHSHSFIPAISLNARRAGISAGINFRTTTFFDEITIIESIFSFYGYFNFVNSETLRLGLSCGNFGEYYARNMGSYSIKFISSVRLDRSWLIMNELELMQSGGDGLSTTLYGFAWRGGARFSW